MFILCPACGGDTEESAACPHCGALPTVRTSPPRSSTRRRAAVVGLGAVGGAVWLRRRFSRSSTRTSDAGRGSYVITIENVAEQLLAAARERMNIDHVPRDIQRVLGVVWDFLRRNPGLRTDGHNVAMYWDEHGERSVEAGVQIVRTFTATEAVVPSATPGGRVATTAYFGPYQQIGSAHDAVRAFCAQHGHERAGPFWEVYGDHDDDPRRLRTDIFYLLK
jgi:effector-binding domain-containing protein